MGSSRRSVPQTNLTPPATTLLPSKSHAEEPLTAFFDHLAQIRILDPACGSGNFLYVALRRLLDLWKEARDLAIANNIHIATGYIADRMPSPLQLFGIETEFYAHELASIVVWIGFLQWKHDNGILEDREPILQKLSNIEHDDAILRYDPEGKPYEPEWPKADYVVGNPPFLGASKLLRELTTVEHPRYVEDLRHLYSERVPGEADLVAFWFEKAREAIAGGRAVGAGLIATQAIRAGANRKVLRRIRNSVKIVMAWSNRPWLLDGANVRVSFLVLADQANAEHPILDGIQVKEIFEDLTSGTEMSSARLLCENIGIGFRGLEKNGKFQVSAEIASKMLSAPQNPNGTHNRNVIKPWINALDVTHRPRGLYVIDFGVDLSHHEAAFYEVPFSHVECFVRPERVQNRRARRAQKWWLFGETGPGLRKAIDGLVRFIVTSRVSKHRIFAWAAQNTVADSRLFVFARTDDYFFGVLQSGLHDVWALATSSRHGVAGDITYNAESCFDTFPFPWPPGTEPTEAEDPRVHAIAEAARTLVRLRDAWLNPPGASEADLKDRTLTRLYNLRAAGKCTWLEDAHRTLDEAVFAAYGWPPTLTTQQILANLLTLNHQRAAAQAAFAPKRPRKANTKAKPPTAASEA